MGDVEAKLASNNLNGNNIDPDVELFLEFNKQEYGEKEFSDDIERLIQAYSQNKKPIDLKRSRNLVRLAKRDKNIFLEKPLFADFEKKVETIYVKLFLEMLKDFPLPSHMKDTASFPPKKITLEVSRAIEDEAENTATIDEKNSTIEHCITKYHGRALCERLFPTFFLNGGSMRSLTKSSRHEMVHFIDLFTINKAEREGLKKLEELNAPYAAIKLYYLLFEFLKEARATTYEFTNYHQFVFTENKGENFRNGIIELCKARDICKIKEIYDKRIDNVTGIYRQSYLAAYFLSLPEDLVNKKVMRPENKLIINCLHHDIRDQIIKDTTMMHPIDFIKKSAESFNKHGLEFYCPLTTQFMQYALEETLKNSETPNKEKIKELFFNHAL